MYFYIPIKFITILSLLALIALIGHLVYRYMISPKYKYLRWVRKVYLLKDTQDFLNTEKQKILNKIENNAYRETLFNLNSDRIALSKAVVNLVIKTIRETHGDEYVKTVTLILKKSDFFLEFNFVKNYLKKRYVFTNDIYDKYKFLLATEID